MAFARLWRGFDNLFLPLAKRAHLVKLRRIEKRVEALSRRMALLQMGASTELLRTVPGLSDMATGGQGAKQGLGAMRQVLESPSFVNWTSVADTMDEIETFLTDANCVLDEYDRGRPKEDRLFVPRQGLKGLF